MSLVDLVPQTLKRQLLDSMAGGIARWAESNGHEGIAKAARKLSSDAEFNEALDRALQVGINRFVAEYDDATR